MAKLKIVANPTFTAIVDIPVAGEPDVPVKFEFKHRTRKELAAWIESATGDVNDVARFKEIVVGWPGLVDEFNDENIELLLENRAGAAQAVAHVYITELGPRRIKN